MVVGLSRFTEDPVFIYFLFELVDETSVAATVDTSSVSVCCFRGSSVVEVLQCTNRCERSEIIVRSLFSPLHSLAWRCKKQAVQFCNVNTVSVARYCDCDRTVKQSGRGMGTNQHHSHRVVSHHTRVCGVW